jgi:hypothetical protein
MGIGIYELLVVICGGSLGTIIVTITVIYFMRKEKQK